MKALLDIKNLEVGIEDKTILKGIDLCINPGEIHVLMGQNGVGKSTLVSALMGDPKFEIRSGTILFEGEDITDTKADQRARLGMFMSFQNPEEIPGVTVEDFLRAACSAVRGEKQKVVAFQKELYKTMDKMQMDHSYAGRYLNVGFSGGEKKKTEILQLLMLKPKIAFLDETDSGLDIDAVRTVTQGIREFQNEGNSMVIITHNAQILEGLKIDCVHVMGNGNIMRTGDGELVKRIIREGYNALEKDGELYA